MFKQSLYHSFQRYRTLKTHVIRALPVAILMPHSACNCQCVMCDIWKGNKNLKQLTEKDIRSLLGTLKKLGTQEVVMSGGEALLNQRFFELCEILHKRNIRVSLLSTGLLLKRNAEKLLLWVDNIIVSLDGNQETHDKIRNVSHAFQKLKEGVQHIKNIEPGYRITARTVIHRLNFREWHHIVGAAKEIGLDQISFLPADVSSHAFNREIPWTDSRQHEILLEKNELPELKVIIDEIIKNNSADGFIAESPEKLRRIHDYYAAFYELNPFPYKKCNAPWVSTVIEADGTVRPCFFHAPIGNIRNDSLEKILNSRESIQFRKGLDTDSNPTCMKCVCYLHLPPRASLS